MSAVTQTKHCPLKNWKHFKFCINAEEQINALNKCVLKVICNTEIEENTEIGIEYYNK